MCCVWLVHRLFLFVPLPKLVLQKQKQQQHTDPRRRPSDGLRQQTRQQQQLQSFFFFPGNIFSSEAERAERGWTAGQGSRERASDSSSFSVGGSEQLLLLHRSLSLFRILCSLCLVHQLCRCRCSGEEEASPVSVQQLPHPQSLVFIFTASLAPKDLSLLSSNKRKRLSLSSPSSSGRNVTRL